jgi:hypothetical protein
MRDGNATAGQNLDRQKLADSTVFRCSGPSEPTTICTPSGGFWKTQGSLQLQGGYLELSVMPVLMLPSLMYYDPSKTANKSRKAIIMHSPLSKIK